MISRMVNVKPVLGSLFHPESTTMLSAHTGPIRNRLRKSNPCLSLGGVYLHLHYWAICVGFLGLSASFLLSELSASFSGGGFLQASYEVALALLWGCPSPGRFAVCCGRIIHSHPFMLSQLKLRQTSGVSGFYSGYQALLLRVSFL